MNVPDETRELVRLALLDLRTAEIKEAKEDMRSSGASIAASSGMEWSKVLGTAAPYIGFALIAIGWFSTTNGDHAQVAATKVTMDAHQKVLDDVGKALQVITYQNQQSIDDRKDLRSKFEDYKTSNNAAIANVNDRLVRIETGVTELLAQHNKK